MSETKNKLINHAQINWSDQLEPISALFNDVYFNTEQGIDESFYVFFQGNNLNERWIHCQSEHFCIAETGFGTGLNFLVCCAQFQKFLNLHPEKKLKHLFFSSFEKYPLIRADLVNALNRWPSLKEYIKPLLDQYPLALTGCHRIHFDQYNITLDLWFGDVQHTLPTLYCYPSGLFDCWFLDGFAPSKNPEMWSDNVFSQISKSCKVDATIATFTAAGFVRRGLIAAGFDMKKRQGYGKKREMLVGQLKNKDLRTIKYAQHSRIAKQTTQKEIAIIGGGIASACLSLALIKRGYKVTLYCKNNSLALGASGNQQGAIYPLLNKAHDPLSQFFANSFLYARNYIYTINKDTPFNHDFSGLLQLYYDQASSKKLDKILAANLPEALVHKLSSNQTDDVAQLAIGQSSLFYPLGGWLNPQQMVNAIFSEAKKRGQLTIKLNTTIKTLTECPNGWELQIGNDKKHHSLIALTTAMETLDFTQAKAVPLSAARGQVTYIPTNDIIKKLKVTLCHEGYLTPVSDKKHSMGATFMRHEMNTLFSAQEQIENKEKLKRCIPNKPWCDNVDSAHNEANVGIRATTRDHFPYVGGLADYAQTKIDYQYAYKTDVTTNAPFHNNAFILTGLGSRGLCTAPLLAEMLASQINQEPLPFSQPILDSLQTNRQWINYLKKSKPLKI